MKWKRTIYKKKESCTERNTAYVGVRTKYSGVGGCSSTSINTHYQQPRFVPRRPSSISFTPDTLSLPLPPSIPFRKTPTIVGLDARDRCRFSSTKSYRDGCYSRFARHSPQEKPIGLHARVFFFLFFFSLSFFSTLVSLARTSRWIGLCSPCVCVLLSFRRITMGLNLDRVRTASYV